MNSYELADKLDEAADELESEKITAWEERTAAIILRQQADRIAELEKEADRLSSHANELRNIHANRIAELEKELKRTKFAWNLAENEIERLAPQTKPLSDEEIYDLLVKCIDSPDDGHEFRYKDFARAIEESHGIK